MRQGLSVSQRQSHLSSMGVSQWYSRTALLGAKASPEELFLELDSGPAVEVAESTSAPKDLLNSLKGGAASSKTEILVEEESSSRKVESSKVTAPTELSGSNAAEGDDQSKSGVITPAESTILPGQPSLSPVGAFSVNCFRTSGLVVISECSGQTGVRRELQLLTNILKSLTKFNTDVSDLDYCQSFNWPVFNSLNLQSSQAAELNEAIGQWLVNVSQQRASVFYFGGSQSALLDVVKMNLSDLSHYSFNYSLQDMLQIPVRKKDIWLQLKKYAFL